ncbi:MAG TPA: hypothetical protein VKB50_05780 [Vicinamibacterales bacterium]|nr:hypothetical protein [Vicinamibacterales bacterium]
MNNKLLLGVCCLLPFAAGAGCAKARAQSVPDGATLAVPAPPSRVFAPIDDEEPLAATPSPATEEPTSAPKANPPGPLRPRRSEGERAEQTPAPTPKPASAPEPPRELRAVSQPTDEQALKRITEQLRRTSQILGNIYYQGLSSGGQENYNQAKGLIVEAERALKERNFFLAETAAGKAAKLAADLSNR